MVKNVTHFHVRFFRNSNTLQNGNPKRHLETLAIIGLHKSKRTYQINWILQWFILNKIGDKLGNFLNTRYELRVNKRRWPDGGANKFL